MDKERILWVDYSKVIGILLVIFGHLALDSRPTLIWVYSVHMPLFFFLSGYTENCKGTIKEILKKSANSLLIPYAFFYLIGHIWWLATKFYAHPTIYGEGLYLGYVRPFIGFLLGEGQETLYSSTTSLHLWFLPALFVCRIIFCIVMKFEQRKKNHLAIIVFNITAIATVFCLRTNQINIYWSIDSALMAIPYYTMGYYIKRSGFLKKITNAPLLLILTVVCASASFYISTINDKTDINTLSFGQNIFLSYICGTLGLLGIVFFTMTFSNLKNRLFLYIGENTLIIFALQGIMSMIVYKVYGMIFSLEINYMYLFNNTEGLLISAVIIMLTLPVVFLICKYAPFILGKRKLNAIKQ